MLERPQGVARPKTALIKVGQPHESAYAASKIVVLRGDVTVGGAFQNRLLVLLITFRHVVVVRAPVGISPTVHVPSPRYYCASNVAQTFALSLVAHVDYLKRHGAFSHRRLFIFAFHRHRQLVRAFADQEEPVYDLVPPVRAGPGIGGVDKKVVRENAAGDLDDMAARGDVFEFKNHVEGNAFHLRFRLGVTYEDRRTRGIFGGTRRQ